MAIATNASSDAVATFTTVNAPALAYAGAVAAGSLLLCGIRAADETVTISSVVDQINGAWTLVSGPADHASTTQRTWIYKFQGSGAGTPTVTVTFAASATATGHLSVVEVTGSSVAVDALGTTRVTSSSSDTTHTSNAVNATAAGASLALLALTTTTTFAAGSGETRATSQQETRLCWSFRTHGASGNQTHAINTFQIDGTTPEGSHSTHHILSVVEAGGGTVSGDAAAVGASTASGVGASTWAAIAAASGSGAAFGVAPEQVGGSENLFYRRGR